MITDAQRDELRSHLVEQLDLLRIHCETYDRGQKVIMLSAATTVRVLVHGEGALLKQLGVLDDFPFIDGTPAFIEGIVASGGITAGLAMIQMGGETIDYEPVFKVEGVSQNDVGFSEWWTKPIAVDGRRNTFTRRNLVLGVSNKDGGAHVDLSKGQYSSLPRTGFPSTLFQIGDGPEFNVSPLPAMIRQISEEVLTGGEDYLARNGGR